MQPLNRGSRVLVLVADDERSIATVVEAVVEDLGHQARVAAHGRQAMELARDAWPALVITDLMMPELDGAGLIAMLRAEAAAQGRPPVPVILMTAGGLEHAYHVGADAVLPKPFNLEELEALILRLLAADPAREEGTP